MRHVDPKALQVATPSRAGFKAWLEQQPAWRTANYSDCNGCWVGRYLISCGTNWHGLSDVNGDLLNELNLFAFKAHQQRGSLHINAAEVLAQMLEG